MALPSTPPNVVWSLALLGLVAAAACGSNSQDGMLAAGSGGSAGSLAGASGISGAAGTVAGHAGQTSAGSGGTAVGGTGAAGDSSAAGAAPIADAAVEPLPDAEMPMAGNSSAGEGGMNATGGMSGASGMSGTGGDAGGAGTAGSGDPSCQGGDQVDFALVGWASQAGGTTGGRGGTTVTVNTGAALVTALSGKRNSTTPLTILVSGRITEANSGVNKIDVKDVRDVSIIGTGSGAEFDGIGIKIVRASNIVIRNLRIHHVAIGDKDAISIEGPADHIWIDHCELYAQYQGADKDFYDGLLDAKGQAEYITYSWNYLHDSWKTSLVGSSESDTFDRKITMHHNHYRNCNSRLPLYRGGQGHVFNNYYVDIADTGINARIGACLKIEANHFSNARNPWVSAFSNVLGGGDLSCNVLSNGSAFSYSGDVRQLPACTASVPYDYASVLNHPDHVRAVVMANAGVGKLENPAQF